MAATRRKTARLAEQYTVPGVTKTGAYEVIGLRRGRA